LPPDVVLSLVILLSPLPDEVASPLDDVPELSFPLQPAAHIAVATASMTAVIFLYFISYSFLIKADLLNFYVNLYTSIMHHLS
jgi:hypothetical protein